MSDTSDKKKSFIRSRIKSELVKISFEQRQKASEEAGTLLLKQPAWQNAAAVLFYAPIECEIDLQVVLSEGLRLGKIIALPKFDPLLKVYAPARIESLNQLSPGRFGVLEPNVGSRTLRLNQLDLAFVPGIAFDLCGRRLGRGRGYYDRLLAELCGWKCGVAFDFQIVEGIPVEPHDILMNCILTPTRWLTVEPSAV